MSCNSASVGFCPSDRITVPSSLVVIVPSPSLSKRLNASLNSEKYMRNTIITDCSTLVWSISGLPGAKNYMKKARFARVIVRVAHRRYAKHVARFARKILYIETRESVSISFKSE